MSGTRSSSVLLAFSASSEAGTDPRFPHLFQLLQDRNDRLGYYDNTYQTFRRTYLTEPGQTLPDEDSAFKLRVISTVQDSAARTITSYLTDGCIYDADGLGDDTKHVRIIVEGDYLQREHPRSAAVLSIPYPNTPSHQQQMSENLDAIHAAAIVLLTDDNRISPFTALNPAQP